MSRLEQDRRTVLYGWAFLDVTRSWTESTKRYKRVLVTPAIQGDLDYIAEWRREMPVLDPGVS